MNHKLASFILTISSVFSANALAEPEVKGTPSELKQYLTPEKRIIHLSDSAEQKANTDQAIVSLLVKTEHKLLGQSIKYNAQLQTDIRRTLISSGISNKNINNAKFSSSPEFGWFGDKPKSFNVANKMSIKIDQSAHLQTIASLVDKYAEVSLVGTEFEHSKKEQYEQMVKEMALKKILEKKSFYEQSLGLKLKAIGFRESSFEQEVVVASGLRQKKSAKYSMSSTHTLKPASNSFDEINYQANITVEFIVED